MTLFAVERYTDPIHPDHDEMEDAIIFYERVVPCFLFCPWCKHHYLQRIQDSPPEVRTTAEMVGWRVRVQNSVNLMLRKPVRSAADVVREFPYQQADAKRQLVWELMQLYAFEAYENPYEPTLQEQTQTRLLFANPGLWLLRYLEPSYYSAVPHTPPPATQNREALARWFIGRKAQVTRRALVFEGELYAYNRRKITADDRERISKTLLTHQLVRELEEAGSQTAPQNNSSTFPFLSASSTNAKAAGAALLVLCLLLYGGLRRWRRLHPVRS